MTINPDWDKEQFLTFVLLYSANADLQMTEDEEDYIASQIGEEEYDEVKGVFEDCTEMERAEIIVSYAQGEEFDREFTQMIKNDILGLFMADGEFAHWEISISRALVRVMNI